MTTSVSAASGISVGQGTVLIVLAVFLAVAGTLLATWRRERRHVTAATERVRRSEERWRRLAESSPVGVFETDAEGRRVYMNGQLFEINGLPPDTALGSVNQQPWRVVADDQELVHECWRQAAADRSRFKCRFRIRRADDEVRWLYVEASPLVADETITGWVGTVLDTTEETELQRRLEQLGAILEATPDLVGVFDATGRVQYANAAARRFFGWSTDADVTTARGVDLYGPSTRKHFLSEVLPIAEREGVWSGEITIRHPNGEELPGSQTVIAHKRPDGSVAYYSAITHDLSERKAFEAQIARAGLFDPLTGLPNRVLLVDRLAQALARASRTDGTVAVLILDLDRFKLINDSYGHDTGDALIGRTAIRLSEALRPGDTVARFSGDTFCILCEDVADEAGAIELADQFSAALAAPFELDGERLFLTCSIGIAVSGPSTVTAETLLRDADAAMHRAKERGQGRHAVFAEDVRASAVHRLRTANDLHRALTDKEFRLVYQPEVRLDDGHITAVEALVRWHHPERGLVPPQEFVLLAEETGLIEGIGHWVIDEAVAQAAQWSTSRWDGRPLPVWVNLSARQLANERLVEDVANALARHGADPSQVGLEITESALLEDADAGLAALAALRSLGVRLAVDDFGTGYSSLAYLKRLPVDAVKIDRSFVDGLGADADDTAIVAAIAGMAQALRLTTIAEGVETRVQLLALRDVGCELAQGYFFSTPQPALTVTRLLESDRNAALFAFDDQRTRLGEATVLHFPPAPREGGAAPVR